MLPSFSGLVTFKLNKQTNKLARQAVDTFNPSRSRGSGLLQSSLPGEFYSELLLSLKRHGEGGVPQHLCGAKAYTYILGSPLLL